jgi:Ala-tRNA(Pro) deacylase
MPMLSRLQDFLNRNHVSYGHTVHSPTYTARQLARAEHVPPKEVAKAVVFFSEEGYGMAVLPADCSADLRELRELLGLSCLRLATEEELSALFPDSEQGAEPPFGNLYSLPVYVDDKLCDEDVIAFNAGTHRDAAYMLFRDFIRVVQPEIVPFSRLKEIRHG